MRKQMNNTFQLSINQCNKLSTKIAARLNHPSWTGSRSAMQPALELPLRHIDLARRSGIEDPVERIDRSGLDRQHGGGSRPGAARADV
jgi:hypothetical protein